jgi:hypothetical protein
VFVFDFLHWCSIYIRRICSVVSRFPTSIHFMQRSVLNNNIFFLLKKKGAKPRDDTCAVLWFWSIPSAPNSPTNRDTMSALKLFCVIFKIKVVFLGKNSNIKLCLCVDIMLLRSISKSSYILLVFVPLLLVAFLFRSFVGARTISPL